MEQGRVAACYALGIPFKLTVDPLIPFGVYAIPECAMVGLTEDEAVARGINSMSDSYKYAAYDCLQHMGTR